MSYFLYAIINIELHELIGKQIVVNQYYFVMKKKKRMTEKKSVIVCGVNEIKELINLLKFDNVKGYVNFLAF